MNLKLKIIVIKTSLILGIPWWSTAGGQVLIPGQGTKIPQAAWHGQKNKQKKVIKTSLILGIP